MTNPAFKKFINRRRAVVNHADLPGHFALAFRGLSNQYRVVFNPWIWRRKIGLPAIVRTRESFWFVGNFIVFGKYDVRP